ncbi:MAG: pre-peptidase C-terminal domain-containing protein, partial [Rhodopirellula sp. JB044]|uniref:pre-peptidase C-terminal domain-containing protein n=1 Tax=Rhodopirellula sp. JB044 TaxID=3342844 RepID=UPI00370AC318
MLFRRASKQHRKVSPNDHRQHAANNRLRRSRIEKLEARWLLAASVAGEPSVSLTDSLPEPIAELSFEPLFDDRDLSMARYDGSLRDGFVDRLSIHVDSPTELSLYIDMGGAADRYAARLFDSNGNSIVSASWLRQEDVVDLFASEPGSYVIEIEARSNGIAPFDYQLRVLQGDLPFETRIAEPSLSATPGVFQTSVAGVITSGLNPEDIDSFSLGTLAPGTEINVLASTPANGTVVPILEVYGPDGILLDQQSARQHFQGVTTITGEYRVRVRNEAIQGDSRYVLLDKMSWTAADHAARDLGGHLLAINSQEEQSLVESFGEDMWLGLNLEEQDSPEMLQWTSGQNVTFSNWADGHPLSNGPALVAASGDWMMDNYPSWRSSLPVVELPRVGAEPDESISGADGLYVLDVTIIDSTAPQVTGTSGIPTHDLVATSPIATIELALSERTQISEAPDSIVDLREAGADGELFTDDDRMINVATEIVQWSQTSQLDIQVTDGPLANGFYHLFISDRITDRFGNPLAGGEGFSKSFEIAFDSTKHIFEGISNDTIATATPIPLTADTAEAGLLHNTKAGLGLVESSEDVDYWSFEAPADSMAVIRLTSTRPHLVELLDKDQNVLATQRQKSNSDYLSLDARHLSLTGPSFLRVTRIHGTNDNTPYQLALDLSTSIPMAFIDDSSDNKGDFIQFDELSNPRAGSVTSVLSGQAGPNGHIFPLSQINAGSTVKLRASLPSWSMLKPFVDLYQGFSRVLDLDVSEEVFHGKVLQDAEYFAVIRADVGTGLHGQYILDVEIEDDVAPLLLDTIELPRDGEVGNEFIGWFGLTFSERMRLTGQEIDLRESGADGIFGTDDDRIYEVELAGDTVSPEFKFVIPDGPLPSGLFQMTVTSDATDLSGNALGTDTPNAFIFEIDALDTTQIFEGAENDSRETATFLPREMDSGGTSFARTIPFGVGAIETSDDSDWWRVEAHAGETLRITLKSEHGAGVTFEIHDANGKATNYDITEYSFAPEQFIVAHYDVPGDEDYYIRVISKFGSINRLNTQQNYQLRVDSVAETQTERRERSNDSFYFSDALALQQTTEGYLFGTFSGTLLVDDQDAFHIGNIDEGLETRLSIDRPEWSHVEPRIFLRENYDITELTPEDDGTYRVLSSDATEYDIKIAADPLNTGTGIDGQYLVNVDIRDAKPLSVTDVRGLPSDGGDTDFRLSEFDVTFSRPLNEQLAINLQPSLIGAGADGEFGTDDDHSYNIQHEFRATEGNIEYDTLHFHLDTGANVLQEGRYQLHLPGTLRSRYGSPLGAGEGFSTTFSIGELPRGYRWEGPENDAPAGAVHLEPESPGSEWFTRGIGSLEREDDVDYWSIDAEAGALVTAWTPSRAGDSFIQINLSDHAGESISPVVAQPDHDENGAFEQFRIPSDGTYYLQLTTNALEIPDDRLYEVWVNVTPQPEGQTASDHPDSDYPYFAESARGTTAVVAGHFDVAELAQTGDYESDMYDLSHVPEGTVVQLEVLATTWANAAPYGVVAPLNSPINNGNIFTGTVTDATSTQLIVRPRSRHDADPIAANWNVDYIAKIRALDVVAPSVTMNTEEVDGKRIIHAEAKDSDDMNRLGSRVVSMSLFSIRDGILEHLVSNPTDTIELELPVSGTDVVLATAADRVGNRSGFNLSEYDLGHVTVNSSIVNESAATLPSRITVGPETRLTWTGSWDVLSPQSNGEQTI